MKRTAACLLTFALLAGLAVPTGAAEARKKKKKKAPPSQAQGDGRGDATVVAVLDYGLNPYHWDFLSSRMPQHKNGDPSDDLPLQRPPHEWIPDFPDPAKEFAQYGSLKLTLEEKNAQAGLEGQKAKDQAEWSKVAQSKPGGLNYYWIPDTKVIGAMTFSGSTKIVGVDSDHGVGTTSSSVGNLHGTCPECLLLFIELGSVADSEKAIEWAMDQPWIDVITNSYGFSAAYRDRIYSGSNVEAQAKASTRGQTIFFSAGNGNDGAFVVPNTTSFSSQEGPDWIVTVGAVSPGENNYYYKNSPNSLDAPNQTSYHGSYSGHGKPSDIAGIGSKYPTAYYSEAVGETGTRGFGGTSNATPQVAGTYARALYVARRAMEGDSKIQKGGVIAKGRFECGRVREKCELKDNELTAVELRQRLFEGAIHTPAGINVGGIGNVPATQEEEFLNEGHGSYFGLETGKWSDYMDEFARIVEPLFGSAKPLERPKGELEWMIVDSFCRQQRWGSWNDGYYQVDKTALPPDDPSWPLRTAYKNSCR